MNIFNRTEQLIGSQKLQLLTQARVAVFGMGGVGSFATEALARAGVGYLRVVDFDVVHYSNLNRQLYALHSSLNQPKVFVAAARLRDINPACQLDVRQEFVDQTTVGELLEGPLDLVVDAIDSVSSKVHLIREAVGRGYAVVSSMGAAGQLDANAITTGDISESYNCPLARIIRKRLHRHGIYKGVRCVYSTEKSQNKLPPLTSELEAETLQSGQGRERVPLGSISYVTALFGLKAAYEAISLVLGQEQRDAEPKAAPVDGLA
jgi:tRNA A37 threonylcarbamoyladenosine dehydratase